MFGVDSSEFLLIAIVALVVIGPKDLPKAMRVVGYWVGKARAVSRSFRQGFDNMVREAELEEMEKRWAAENARIMAEHPAAPANADPTDGDGHPDMQSGVAPPPLEAHDERPEDEPVMVEKPAVLPSPDYRPTPQFDRKPS